MWGDPIGAHQGVAHPLAEAKIELELARLMTQKAAALYDAGAPGAGEASNMAKYAAAEAGIQCVDRAIQTHGGNGFALEYGLSDLWWGVASRGPRRCHARWCSTTWQSTRWGCRSHTDRLARRAGGVREEPVDQPPG